MKYTRFLIQDEARSQLLAGATALATAVRGTLGPKPKCVVIGKQWGLPIICDDGVTIAKSMTLKDPEQQAGLQLLRQASEQTSEAVGDGTTTATLLAHALMQDGIRNIVAGSNAINLKRGLERAAGLVVAAISAISKPITRYEQKVQVATISAHNDAEIGRLVADAIEKVGGDGVISVEEAKGTETVLEVVDGLQFDRGFLSPYFINDREHLQVTLQDPYLLLFEKRISNMAELVVLLEQVVKTGKPLLIIAEDVEGDALATMVVNHLRGILPCAAVKAPGFGESRLAQLEDIAVLTGGQVIADALGMKLGDIQLPMLGKAKRVLLTKDKTTIIGGAGERKQIEARCNEIRQQITDNKSDYDREKLEQRLGKLSGGVAVMRVGAVSESELKMRKEAFDDAISATRAAVAEGIVPGAGFALLHARKALTVELSRLDDPDEVAAFRILQQALELPTRQLAMNVGMDPGVVVERMSNAEGNYGLDGANRNYVDLIATGIIDPTKVVRVALQNAVSVAAALLMADASLTEIDEPENKGKATAAEPEF